MLDSISPYALLQASRPKPAPTRVTAYDLYSAAQSSAAQPASSPVPPASAGMPSPMPAPPAARRTHYIADIKSRHNAAIRRAPLHNQPLS